MINESLIKKELESYVQHVIENETNYRLNIIRLEIAVELLISNILFVEYIGKPKHCNLIAKHFIKNNEDYIDNLKVLYQL